MSDDARMKLGAILILVICVLLLPVSVMSYLIFCPRGENE